MRQAAWSTRPMAAQEPWRRARRPRCAVRRPPIRGCAYSHQASGGLSGRPPRWMTRVFRHPGLPSEQAPGLLVRRAAALLVLAVVAGGCSLADVNLGPAPDQAAPVSPTARAAERLAGRRLPTIAAPSPRNHLEPRLGEAAGGLTASRPSRGAGACTIGSASRQVQAAGAC